MRRADFLRIRLAANWDHLRAHHFSRGIAPFAFGSRAVDLYQLREVAAIFERVHDGRTIRRETVCGDLEIL